MSGVDHDAVADVDHRQLAGGCGDDAGLAQAWSGAVMARDQGGGAVSSRQRGQPGGRFTRAAGDEQLMPGARRRAANHATPMHRPAEHRQVDRPLGRLDQIAARQRAGPLPPCTVDGGEK